MPDKNTESVLIETARKISEPISESCALIGGVCSFLYGSERFTRDIDFASTDSPEAVQEKLQKQGISSKITMGAWGDPLSWVVSGKVDSVEFQVLSANDVGVDVTQAVFFGDIPVASLQDLITSKCRAGGQQDMHDVAVMSLLHPDCVNHAKTMAAKCAVEDKLNMWLSDARLLERYGHQDEDASSEQDSGMTPD